MRQAEYKRKSKRGNLVIAIFVVFTVAVLIAAVLAAAHVRRLQAEAKEHMTIAVSHINDGAYKAVTIAEVFITFFALIEQAESAAESSEYERAITLYEKALNTASAISFSKGVNSAKSGIDEMHERIIIAKRNDAMNLILQGDELYNNQHFAEALIYFYEALEIYLGLDDRDEIFQTKIKIEIAERRLADTEAQEPPLHDGTQDDTEIANSDEIAGNFAHNSSIDFDFETLIDNQNHRPANLIRMGSSDGLNEGWYNGCGWVATYNALIILGQPKHPADIVKHFEESGGTVLGGIFGTYPNAIENYLKGLGYSVNHTLFPQISMNLDDAIKASRVSILAYMHTGAAHYVTVEYLADIDRFIIYNDIFAHSRSENLGFQNDTNVGAAIDSVDALMSSTRSILFSFSLITVN